jgi:hypothetical protein
MSDAKEYILKMRQELKTRIEKAEKLGAINATIEKIGKELESLIKKTTDANSEDLSMVDKNRITALTVAYDEQVATCIKLLAGEKFIEGEYPVYHKSTGNKMILKKLHIDGHSALCSWIDASGIDIEREFALTELTRKMPV